MMRFARCIGLCVSLLLAVCFAIFIPANGLLQEDEIERPEKAMAHPAKPDLYSPYETHQDPLHPLDPHDPYQYHAYSHSKFPLPDCKENPNDPDNDCAHKKYPLYPVPHYPYNGPYGHYPGPHFPFEHHPEPYYPNEHLPEPYYPYEHHPEPYYPYEHLPEPFYPYEHHPEPYYPYEHLPEPIYPYEHHPEPYFPYEHHPEPFYPYEHHPEPYYPYEHHPEPYYPYEHHPEPFYPFEHHPEPFYPYEHHPEPFYPYEHSGYQPYYPHHPEPYYPEHHYEYKPDIHYPIEPLPEPHSYELPHYPVPPQAPLPNLIHHGQPVTCEWRMVFKAVAGNHRNVYEDYTKGGNMNIHTPHAYQLGSPIVYRDGDVLDLWDHIVIPKVKVEVFVRGRRGVWFIFNGLGSTCTNWFSPDRLLASPYHDLKSGDFNFFSVEGDSALQTSFLINRNYANECLGDCGYLAVVDDPASNCRWKCVGPSPLFIYNTKPDECGLFNSPAEAQYGDRLVISINLCAGDLHNNKME